MNQTPRLLNRIVLVVVGLVLLAGGVNLLLVAGLGLAIFRLLRRHRQKQPQK